MNCRSIKASGYRTCILASLDGPTAKLRVVTAPTFPISVYHLWYMRQPSQNGLAGSSCHPRGICPEAHLSSTKLI
jgi:hypothetical protein